MYLYTTEAIHYTVYHWNSTHNDRTKSNRAYVSLDCVYLSSFSATVESYIRYKYLKIAIIDDGSCVVFQQQVGVGHPCYL